MKSEELRMNTIDLIIPMVFPADPQWQQEYAMYNGSPAAAMSHVRYRSWGTEELLVRCCLKYLPWLRRIHLLLASESQVQPWMERIKEAQAATDGPQLSVVFHRDIMPSDVLPCFSSPCFEMFLDRVPGLSEHFIYANDDMFPLSPLSPEDFFRDGLPCIVFRDKAVPAAPNIFQRKCMNQQEMIARGFGKTLRRVWLKSDHSFAPLVRSTCLEVWQRHGDAIRQYLSPRRRTDHSYNHYVYMLWQYFSGAYIEHAPREQYVGGSVPADSLRDILLDPVAGIVCLNDNEKINDWQQRARIVRDAIREKLDSNL